MCKVEMSSGICFFPPRLISLEIPHSPDPLLFLLPVKIQSGSMPSAAPGSTSATSLPFPKCTWPPGKRCPNSLRKNFSAWEVSRQPTAGTDKINCKFPGESQTQDQFTQISSFVLLSLRFSIWLFLRNFWLSLQMLERGTWDVAKLRLGILKKHCDFILDFHIGGDPNYLE